MDHTMLGFESSAAATIAGRTASRNYMLSMSSPSVRDLYVGVKTNMPLVYGAGDNPVSGSILVTGAASSVTITAVDAASVRLDLSARGDGVITESRTMPWPEFEKSF
jgi:NADPH:quinone reductase-like Zn-dependent oxidoreductase